MLAQEINTKHCSGELLFPTPLLLLQNRNRKSKPHKGTEWPCNKERELVHFAAPEAEAGHTKIGTVVPRVIRAGHFRIIARSVKETGFGIGCRFEGKVTTQRTWSRFKPNFQDGARLVRL
jgi:hypothetical protein